MNERKRERNNTCTREKRLKENEREREINNEREEDRELDNEVSTFSNFLSYRRTIDVQAFTENCAVEDLFK